MAHSGRSIGRWGLSSFAPMKKKKKRSRGSVSTTRPKRRRRNNQGRILIGEFAEKLSYQGGRGKPKNSRWVHDFISDQNESPVRVYGMPDGTITLEPVKKGVRLWDWFDDKV